MLFLTVEMFELLLKCALHACSWGWLIIQEHANAGSLRSSRPPTTATSAAAESGAESRAESPRDDDAIVNLKKKTRKALFNISAFANVSPVHFFEESKTY